MGTADVFNGMDSAPMFGSGAYFAAGHRYALRTKTIKVHDGFKGKTFIAEFEVLESSSEKDPPGSTRSYVVKLGAGNVNAFSDIKALMFAILGTDPKKAGQPSDNPPLHAQAADAVKCAVDRDYAASKGVAPDAFEGLPVRLETTTKKTKAGNDFTVHVWQPAPLP